MKPTTTVPWSPPLRPSCSPSRPTGSTHRPGGNPNPTSSVSPFMVGRFFRSQKPLLAGWLCWTLLAVFGLHLPCYGLLGAVAAEAGHCCSDTGSQSQPGACCESTWFSRLDLSGTLALPPTRPQLTPPAPRLLVHLTVCRVLDPSVRGPERQPSIPRAPPRIA